MKMLDNLSSIYNYSDDDIDKMLNQIINIDNEKFSQILIELNNLAFVPTDQPQKERQIKQKIKQEQKEEIIMDSTPLISEKEQKEKEHSNKQEVVQKQEPKKIEQEKEITVEKDNTQTQNIELKENDVSSNVPFDFLMNS